MANDFNPSDFFNPMMWTDLGLRALDMTVSSTQDVSERVDRLTRAGAEPAEDTASTSADLATETVSVTSNGVALAADLQRTTFDMLTQAWVQWISTLGRLASLGTGLALGQGSNAGNIPLDAMRMVLLPTGRAGTATAPAQTGSSSRQQGGRQREARASRSMEHAIASAEPKRRRGASKPKAKVRRSRNS
ncbi:MAG TPA: hypothetical protein VNN06_02340 [Ramlibacter sp.]|nr:hypothetical protein [Ramlibacter sp.]